MLYHRQTLGAVSACANAICLLAAPLNAQSAEPLSDRPIEDDLHDRRIGPDGAIIVTAPGLRELDVLAGASVLEGPELLRELDGQLGDIVSELPGVSATSFAPGSSRPVLRGFQGERVRVLIDGIGAIDVSNTSVDHAVAIDPLTAERIEVLRGPAVLLYGSQAIGGAVNVIDKRIPRRVPDEALHLDALVSADTAFDLRQGAGSVDVPVGGGFVVHFDGSYRTTDDLEVPGFTLSPQLRAEILEEAAEEEAEGEFEEAEELREAAEQRGFLPNSGTETFGANAGFAFFRGDSSFGASFGIYDTRYGVTKRPGLGHAHGHGEDEGHEDHDEDHEDEDHDHEGHDDEERVDIDLRQYRADFRGDVDLGEGAFSRLILRAGYSDYTHTEFEGDEVGTVFDVEGIEARAELVQRPRGSWRGSVGAQYYFRDFDAFGAEAYVPRNQTDQIAFFTLQEFGDGPLQFELAGRYENTSVESGPLGIERDFDAVSGAAGIAYQLDGVRVGVNGSRVERAPSAEELFSDGPHIATQAFEIGNPNFDIESAWGVEAYARGRVGRAELSVAVYHSWFDDYIYLADTGEEEDELPVFQYLQDDANYFGVEGQVVVPLFAFGPAGVNADLRATYIEAELDDGTNLPRIPPLSLLGALEAAGGPFDARVEVQYFAEQEDTAPFETFTDDFTFVNASISWAPIRGDDTIRLLLQAQNILDVTGRRHASFTKDFIPLAGRNFRATASVSF
jgi:iron complex outermembrane receptor protein